ncbi:uncharacterized protein LOC129004415 [Macrosteles quadrilineatus]|uniref:uncharacterized protein LOC129004415 n=1 Tax=Macrosteles quadrilineatus TaxID=74068 RepID=UPI0023E16B14|nr:uncharacterized protein LOC129004415 [Macrosteles quadrilineatus]
MKVFTLEEDEKLVEAISPHPEIYNLRHPLYKDQRARNNVWEAISEEVGRSIADCKKRWRNIKDTHDRRIRENNKTGSEAPPCKKGKKWQLEEQLSFLHTADVKRKSFCNINSGNEENARDEQDDSVGLNVSDNEQDTLADAAAYVPPQPTPPKLVSPKNNSADQQKKMTYRDKISFAIEKCSKERDVMIMNLLQKDDETDDDISLFFKSIAKSVQKMPPNLQQRAKLETLSLISNIESDMWASRENSQMVMLPSPSLSVLSEVSMSSTSQDAQTHLNVRGSSKPAV